MSEEERQQLFDSIVGQLHLLQQGVNKGDKWRLYDMEQEVRDMRERYVPSEDE